jgi:hypothetical protein
MMRILATGALALCAFAVAAPSFGAPELKHGAIADPTTVAIVQSKQLRIGTITHVVTDGAVVYVAGQEGVAAIGSDGTPLWATRLPKADLRVVGVDGSGVAFVAQNMVAADPGPLADFLQGTMSTLPTFKDTTVGLLDKGRRGALVWTAPLDTADRVAPPGMSGPTIAVTDGTTLALFDRTAGSERKRMPTFPSLLAGMKVFQGVTRNAPLFANESFIVGFLGNLKSVDAVTGKENWSVSSHGLMSAFSNITAGPLLWGDRIVFGNSRSSRSSGLNDITRVFASDLKGKDLWDNRSDKHSGVSSLFAQGDRLFVASNFTLSAYSANGKELWWRDTAGTDGALTISQFRGVRYYLRSKAAVVAESLARAVLGGNESEDLAARTGYGNCLTADERYVYLSSIEHSKHHNDWGLVPPSTKTDGREVVTVVDAATGDYVTSLDAKGLILDLLVAGPNLVVADFDEVRFFKRPD